MLDPSDVAATARALRSDHRQELNEWNQTYDYLTGASGIPVLPTGAGTELHEIARLSVKNIMPLVVDTFTQALAVGGFRSPSAETDAAVWAIWQREHMDARQAAIHRPAVAYGAAYVVLTHREGVEAVEWRLRTPRQVIAHYADPSQDEWPEYALEVWVVGSGSRRHFEGVLYDEVAAYPVKIYGEAGYGRIETVSIGDSGEPGTPHTFGVCPVVRFLNDRDTDGGCIRGEVQPLITDQQAINAVNFDRLVVSKYGAFPQKVITGWAPPEQEEASLPQLSSRRILAFADDDVKVQHFPAATVTAYNEILEEMIIHAALKARVNVAALTGDVSNVGAETIALVDAPNQRKIAAKQRSFGESWEQALRLAGQVEGVEVPDDAEVVWVETEARSFSQVVDGIGKLTVAGVPVESLLDQIPNLSQQKVDAIRESIRKAGAAGIAAQIIQAARTPAPPTTTVVTEPAATQPALF